MVFDGFGYRVDEFRREEHSRLQGGRWQIIGQGLELSPDERLGDALGGPDPHRILGGDGNDHRSTVDTERLKGLEIGLDAGPTARVRSRNREGNFHGVDTLPTNRDSPSPRPTGP